MSHLTAISLQLCSEVDHATFSPLQCNRHVAQPIQGTAALCLSYTVVSGYTHLSHFTSLYGASQPQEEWWSVCFLIMQCRYFPRKSCRAENRSFSLWCGALNSHRATARAWKTTQTNPHSCHFVPSKLKCSYLVHTAPSTLNSITEVIKALCIKLSMTVRGLQVMISSHWSLDFGELQYTRLKPLLAVVRKQREEGWQVALTGSATKEFFGPLCCQIRYENHLYMNVSCTEVRQLPYTKYFKIGHRDKKLSHELKKCLLTLNKWLTSGLQFKISHCRCSFMLSVQNYLSLNAFSLSTTTPPPKKKILTVCWVPSRQALL